jgi:hypothetical protein
LAVIDDGSMDRKLGEKRGDVLNSKERIFERVKELSETALTLLRAEARLSLLEVCLSRIGLFQLEQLRQRRLCR